MQSSVLKPLLPVSRLWWAGLAALLLLAGGLFYTGYNFSLPYIDHPDEPAFNLAAQMTLDQGSAKLMSFHAYPPGIISVNFLALKFLRVEGMPSSSILGEVRLLTITAWMGSLVVMVLLGYQATNGLTGLLAGLVWVLLPLTNQNVRFAIPNGYLSFFVLLSLWLIFIGVQYRRPTFRTAATYMLMLATVFKTQAIFLFPLLYFLPLWLVYQKQATWREMFIELFWNGVRIGLFVFWLLVFYPTLEADTIPYFVAPSSSIHIPSPDLLWTHLTVVLNAYPTLLGWLVTFLSFALLLIPVFRQRVNHLLLLVLVSAGGLWLFGISLFGAQDLRQMYVVGALVLILASVVWSLWLVVGQQLLQRVSSSRYIPQIAAGGLLVMVGVGVLPFIPETFQTTYDYTLPDRRNDLAHYMDTSLEPAPFITTKQNHKTLNAAWGGYWGQNQFPMFAEASITEKSFAEWRENGVRYAILPYEDYQQYIQTNAEARQELLLLKSYPTDARYRGPNMVVLSLNPIQHALDAHLGSIRLVGYNLNTSEIKAGENLVFTLYWQADAPVTGDYKVFNHLVLENTTDVVAQVDGFPLFDSRRPTSTWNDPAEVLVSQTFTITIPENTPTGEYSLLSGFYLPADFSRLLNPAGESSIQVVNITIKE